MPDSHASEAPARSASGLTPYLLLVLLSTLPLVGLGVYAHRIAGEAVEQLVESNNLAAARFTRELVERDFRHRVSTLEGFASLPGVIDAVRNADEEGVRRRLQVLVESQPEVERAFVTDRAGLLWSDYPRAAESLGKRFDLRGWFKGLSRSWEPYVSDVYRRHAEPRPLLVAIAAAVRDGPGGEILGTVTYQIRLEALSRLLEQVEVGRGGFVFLLDHGGMVAAHPQLDLQAREYGEYASPQLLTRITRARGAAEPRGVRYVDPLSGERMLATAVPCDVQGRSWTVIAQQPASEAYAAITTLGWQIAGAGLLLATMVGGLCIGLARFHGRVHALNRRLGEVNQALVRENADRITAEQALQRSHHELERRVEERTRELRQKEEQLLQSQKMEAIGRLAGGIAHDFNNLLTVIISYGDLALAQIPSGSRVRDDIEEIRNAGERAASLTRQLLAFSRKQVLQPEVLDLNDVVDRMDKMLRRVIGEDVDLVTKLRPNLQKVRFDPGQIEQIIMNLAVNARDAMPQGGKLTLETANVELDEDYARSHQDARPGPHVMLAVTDTGVGMDAETKARVFEPFFTTKELGRGTGLGLATVYGIVKQSGGNVWIYSESGKGTTFKVYLPCAQDQLAVAKPRAIEAPPSRGTETILVVEDEAAVRNLVVNVLGEAGYTVVAASDPDQALELCDRHEATIHLVLTDVVLPRMGGPRLADLLLQKRSDLKLLFMSGYTDDTVVHHGVLDARMAFLQKPISPTSLLRKVREVLEGSEGPP